MPAGLPPGVEIIRDEAGFAGLVAFWDRLVEQSSTRSPFQRWDWARLWWACFGGDYKLSLVVVRGAHGAVEAIAPLVIGFAPSGARRFLRQLCWLGGVGTVEGEVMDFLVPAGREAELTPRLCEGIRTLAPEWQGVRLNKMPADSPNAAILLEHLRGFAVGVGMVNTHASRFTELPAEWETLAARHSGRWRRNLRKRWDKLFELPVACAGLAGRELSASEAMDALGDLHCGRWCASESSFVKNRAWEFHRRLALGWIPQGRAVLPYLAVNGRMIAGSYGFIEGDRFYLYQLGWDKRYAVISPGNLAVKNSMLLCLERGIRWYDMMPGDHRYKLEWCPQGRDLLDVEAYSPASLTAVCFRGLRSIKRLVVQPQRERMEPVVD